MSARIVLHQADIARALTRISHEILESNRGFDDLVLLGIPTRGVILAERIGRILVSIASRDAGAQDAGAENSGNSATPPPSTADLVGSIDVTMYRDDLSRNPTRAPSPTQLPPGGLDGRTVVLVDDVLYSGRTVRAALDAISDLGRPRAVRLATLVDRGHRELPIRADFVGKNLPSASTERIYVRLAEIDGEEFVSVESPEARS